MEQYIDTIIKLGALAAALTAIFTLTRTVVRYFKAKEKKDQEMAAKMALLVAHDKEQRLDILRLTIMNSEMPISERLIAGRKYVDAGGNGDVKHYYQDLLKNHTK